LSNQIHSFLSDISLQDLVSRNDVLSVAKRQDMKSLDRLIVSSANG
jgi:hypothetical protein